MKERMVEIIVNSADKTAEYLEMQPTDFAKSVFLTRYLACQLAIAEDEIKFLRSMHVRQI